MSTHNIYLLDTCICIALLKKNPNVIQHIREVGINNCKISDITLAELYFGAFKSGKEKHFNDVSEISKLLVHYPIQYTRKYGEIRWRLEKRARTEKQTRKKYELHQEIMKLKKELAE